MKKISALILSVIMLFSMTACSSKGTVYTPVYGEKLEISENLEFKKEYKDNISPETRQMISEYITFMVTFYNDIDPSRQQSSYFTYTAYYFTNNFLTNMEIAAADVIAKMESGKELSEGEQIFWDCIEKIFEIPNKLTEVDTAAAANAAGASQSADSSSSQAGASSSGDSSSDSAAYVEFSSSRPRSASDSSSQTASDSSSNSSSDSSSSSDSTQIEYVTLDPALWEELFNVYVDVIGTLYNEPFVR